MGKVIWTPRADSDLREIWRYVATDSPNAADAVIKRIFDKAELAGTQPLMGIKRPELSENARLMFEGRYVLIYEPADDGILIVAVVHAMRDESSWL